MDYGWKAEMSNCNFNEDANSKLFNVVSVAINAKERVDQGLVKILTLKFGRDFFVKMLKVKFCRDFECNLSATESASLCKNV